MWMTILKIRIKVRLSKEIKGRWLADYSTWALIGPGHVTSSRAIPLCQSLDASPVGSINLYNCRKERKESINHSPYANVQAHRSHNLSVLYDCHSVNPAHIDTAPQLN